LNEGDNVFDRLSKKKGIGINERPTSEEREIRQVRSERERFKEEYSRWQRLYMKIREGGRSGSVK